MPGSISRPSSGSGGRDLSVDGRRCSRMPDLRGFMFSVSFLWVIEVVAVLPGHLSLLLGVLHLFVHFDIVMVSM